MLNLKNIVNKNIDESINIIWVGNNPDIITNYQNHNHYVYTLDNPITGVIEITNFKDNIEGETTTQYLKKFFRYKNNNTNDWSQLLPIEEITNISLNVDNNLDLEIHYFFVLDCPDKKVNSKNISIKFIQITGKYEYQITDSEAVLEKDGTNEIILEPKDIYKVFSLSGYQIVQAGDEVDIKFRFTQNNGRTYTDWTPLTQDNIKKTYLDDLRFAQVQYLIKLNDNSNYSIIYDIVLEGDFQNVTANYLKTNRYGIKEDCLNRYLNIVNGVDENGNSTSFLDIDPNTIETNGLSCYKQANVIQELTDINNENISGMLNIYQHKQIIDFGNLLAGNVNSLAGWNVTYFLTDQDGNGIDMYVHEYTLKNIVKKEDIKIIVPNNEFKDSLYKINYANLDLFDVLEVHILKDVFKNAFGIEQRPSQDDIIYFCETNKLYYIKHAQAYKEIMNASIYYKVILEKYSKRRDIQFIDQESKNLIERLTKNTTSEELFSEENKKEEDKIANKDQTYPLSKDIIRRELDNKVKIINKTLYVGNIDYIKNYYDLSLTDSNKNVITYTKSDLILENGDNRTFVMWFNIPGEFDETKSLTKKVFENYWIKNNKNYNLLNNSYSNKGYKVSVEKENLIFEINDNQYLLKNRFLTDVWYGIFITFNQRMKKLEMYIYRRNSDIKITLFNKNSYEKVELYTPDELEDAYDLNNPSYTYDDAISEGFLPVKNEESLETSISTSQFLLQNQILYDIEQTSFNINSDLRVKGNKIYLTNIRIFNDVFDKTEHFNILKQYIIKDADKLILSDNANVEFNIKKYPTINYD